MKVGFKFQNGQEVLDTVSGLTGIIDCLTTTLDIGIQYSVQPKVKDDNIRPEGWYMDEVQLELIADYQGTTDPTIIDFAYEPGDFIRDTVTNVKGTIIRAMIFLNGCIRYTIQPKLIKGNKGILPKPIIVGEAEVELIKAIIVKVPEEKTSGGPSSKSHTNTQSKL